MSARSEGVETKADEVRASSSDRAHRQATEPWSEPDPPKDDRYGSIIRYREDGKPVVAYLPGDLHNSVCAAFYGRTDA